jgi:hypothetical protein
MKRQPTARLFDDTEFLPLFAGLPIQTAEQLAPTPADPSGPPASWDWAGTLEAITTAAQPGAHVGPF